MAANSNSVSQFQFKSNSIVPADECYQNFSCPGRSSMKRPSETDLEKVLQQSVLEELDSFHNPTTKVVRLPQNKRHRATVAEKQRRERINALFTALQSRLPNSIIKRDRCGLLEETCNYIRKLQDELQQVNGRSCKLQANQFVSPTPLAAAAESLNGAYWPTEKINPDVEVKIYGSEGIVRIRSLRKPRYVWRIMEEIEEHGLDLQMSQFFTGDSFFFVYFHGIFKTQTSPTPQIQTSLESRLKAAYYY
eukprot:Gb_39491 [translate_table: standard]